MQTKSFELNLLSGRDALYSCSISCTNKRS